MLTANRASMLAPAPTPNPITLRILLTFSMHCIIPKYVFPLLNLNADDKISMLIIIICSSNSKSYISFFSKCPLSNVLETSHKKPSKSQISPTFMLTGSTICAVILQCKIGNTSYQWLLQCYNIWWVWTKITENVEWLIAMQKPLHVLLSNPTHAQASSIGAFSVTY